MQHTVYAEKSYVIPLINRLPRQIVGIYAAFDKSPARIQTLIDAAPPAENYCADGCLGYIDVVYPGKHIRNIHDKKDTCGVESVNTDLRHYIPILRRQGRCFPRKLSTSVKKRASLKLKRYAISLNPLRFFAHVFAI